MEDANTFERIVRVSRRDSIDEGLIELGLPNEVTPEALKHVPLGVAGRTRVTMFRLGRWVDTDEELREEFLRRDLVPADANTMIDLNVQHPSLLETHPNATHWFDGAHWNYMSFRERLGAPLVVVNVNRRETKRSGWQPFWWYVGIPAEYQ